MICIFIYKCLNTSLLPLFEGWFQYSSSIHEHTTRLNYNIKVSTNNLFIPIARSTNYGLKMFKVNGPEIWEYNSKGLHCLSSDFKNLLNHLIFKYKL